MEKWHAAVVRSAFPSQNAKKRRVSGHFWRDRCLKTLIHKKKIEKKRRKKKKKRKKRRKERKTEKKKDRKIDR